MNKYIIITNIRMKKTINIITYFSFIFMLFACVGEKERKDTKDSILTKAKKERVINVGYINYPPIVYRDINTGKVTGHFAKTIEDIFNQLNIKVNYVETSWTNFSAGLKNNQFDISIAPTFSTIPRAYSVAFTKPLMYVGNSALCKKSDNRFNALMDFDEKGVVIAVTQGEQGAEYARNNIKHAKVKVFSGPDQNMTFMEVVLGRADVALGDSYAVSMFAKEHKAIVRDVLENNPYNLIGVSWAAKYDDMELLYFLNTAIDVMNSTGKIAVYEREFNANWFHPKQF